MIEQTNKIDTLVLVLGNQRAGKTTFIQLLGSRKKLRRRFLGSGFDSFRWVMPKIDDRMCTQNLVCAKNISKWLTLFPITPLLVCHTVRWQNYCSNANLPQVQPLIANAKTVIVILMYPNLEELRSRVLHSRPKAVVYLPQTEQEYIEHYNALKNCCIRNKWKFYTIKDVNEYETKNQNT